MTNTIKYKVIRTLLACVLLVLFTRCDFIFKDEDDKIIPQTSSHTAHKIEIKKDEAKLLVKASQHNLDVRELLNVIQEVDLNSEAMELADTIEDYQETVFNQYNKVAIEHVISIPDHSTIDVKNYLKSSSIPIEEVMTKISSKLNKQISVLDNLSDTSKNKDFKLLAELANKKLLVSLSSADILKEEILNQ